MDGNNMLHTINISLQFQGSCCRRPSRRCCCESVAPSSSVFMYGHVQSQSEEPVHCKSGAIFIKKSSICHLSSPWVLRLLFCCSPEDTRDRNQQHSGCRSNPSAAFHLSSASLSRALYLGDFLGQPDYHHLPGAPTQRTLQPGAHPFGDLPSFSLTHDAAPQTRRCSGNGKLCSCCWSWSLLWAHSIL